MWLTREYRSERYASEKAQGKGMMYCMKTGHRATQCEKMYAEARRMDAELPDHDDNRIFCEACFIYFTEMETRKPRQLAGWGAHTEDRCWYRQSVADHLKEKNEQKRKEKEGESAKPKKDPVTPNPSWGAEDLKRKAAKIDPALRVQEIKASDEEKMTKEEEKKKKEAKDAAGSSTDGPKKDPKRSKKEENKKGKKRKASSSSVIEKKQKKREEEKNEPSDLE